MEKLKTSRIGLVFVRTISGLLAFAFLFISAKKTTITNAILLNNTAPLFVPFIALIWRKKSLNHKLWPGIIVGLIGVGWILKPGVAPGNQFWNIEVGSLCGVLSGFCLSISMISMRVLRTERLFTVLFYYYLFSSLFVLPFSLYEWRTSTLYLF